MNRLEYSRDFIIDSSDIIKRILENENLTYSVFAKKIGVDPKSIYDILNGKIKSITKKLSDRILTVFPNYSEVWIKTGVGEMLISSEAALIALDIQSQLVPKGRPYYDVDFIGGFDLIENSQEITPTYYIDFTPYNKDGVVWCNITGHSMEPAINHGDMIALKEVGDWREFWLKGEIYGIVTNSGLRTVKKVGASKSSGCVRLIPINQSQEYEAQDIALDKIAKVFQVVGAVKKF